MLLITEQRLPKTGLIMLRVTRDDVFIQIHTTSRRDYAERMIKRWKDQGAVYKDEGVMSL